MNDYALFDSARALPDGTRAITPQELSRAPASRRRRVIDVREEHEFRGELGRIAGAALAPLATVTREANGWDHQDEIVLVCRSGGRSGVAARELRALGFSRVINLVGGMIAWNQAGLSVERS
jgi:rhodanese-related sulfurtransferase